MTSDEFRKKVFNLFDRLREAREKHSVLSHELREAGSNLKLLGGIMEKNLSDIAVDNRFCSLSFAENNVQREVAAEQLKQLFDKLREYQETEAEIEELEKCLKGAGYGNVIKGSSS